MSWQFIAIILAASALIYLGSLSVWVVVLGLAAKTMLAFVLALIFGIIGYVVWRLYRWHRQARTPRLIFRGK